MMTLPFRQAAPFPAEAFIRPQPSMDKFKPLMDPNNRPKNTGLPPGQMGVETQARVNAPPPRPGMPDTSASDRVAALGRNASVPGASASITPAPMPARGPTMTASTSPLGGMDTRPLSARGPVRMPGTTNPNAVRVTPMRMPGERQLMIAARRGDVHAASMLYGAGQQSASEDRNRAFQAWRDSQQSAERQAQSQQVRSWQQDDQQQQQAFQVWRDEQEAKRREQDRMETRNWQIQDRAVEWSREDAQRANEGEVSIKPIEGTDYVIPMLGSRAMGTIPVKRKDAPLPANMVPSQVTRDGVTYVSKEERDASSKPTIMWGEDSDMKRVPFQQIVDPTTGEVKLRRVTIVDSNGDGVDDRKQQSGGQAGALPAAGPAKQLPGGGTVRRL